MSWLTISYTRQVTVIVKAIFFFVSVFLTQAFTPYLGYSLLKLGAIDVNFSNSFRWEHALFVGRGWEETFIEIVAFVDLF